MTNYELIKKQGVDDLAQIIMMSKCEFCKGYVNGMCKYIDCSRLTRCKNGIKEWLESEA